jgi:hypothetical protein
MARRLCRGFVHAVVDLPGAALVLTLKVSKVPVATFTVA